MKKVAFAILTVCLIISACSKKDTTVAPPVAAQTWIFDSVTYNTAECYTDTITNNLNLSANNGSASDSLNYCSLTCYFHGPALPTANGTYTVALVNTPVDSLKTTQVTFRLIRGGALNNYMSTGGNGNETVKVTVSNGMINIIGTNIEMAHYNSSYITDSAALSFNITQTR